MLFPSFRTLTMLTGLLLHTVIIRENGCLIKLNTCEELLPDLALLRMRRVALLIYMYYLTCVASCMRTIQNPNRRLLPMLLSLRPREPIDAGLAEVNRPSSVSLFLQKWLFRMRR